MARLVPFDDLSELQWYRTTPRNMLFSGIYQRSSIIVKAPRDDLPDDKFRQSVN
jgi:hypothetical protein